MREAIKTGKTVEEATALALAELGLPEEEVTIEVINLPQKKLFKTIPAKVRITADIDMAAEKAAEKAAAAAQKQAAAAPRPAVPAAPAVPAPAKAPADRRPPAEKAPVPRTDFVSQEALPEVAVDLAENEKARDAVEYLTELCMKMGCPDISVHAVQQGEALILKVDGEDAGSLIGHRGEVMEALSYLTGLVANRMGGDYLKVSLDINRYRSKREANLVALAKRIGTKVARTGRSHTLEPMNPYERRIIHSAISEIEGVKSESTGEGPNRRVVIMSTGANARPGFDGPNKPVRPAGDFARGPRAPRPAGDFANKGPRGPRPAGDFANKGPRGPRPGGDFGPKSNVPTRDFADKPRDANAAPIVPKRTETISDGGDLPLYGKIEL